MPSASALNRFKKSFGDAQNFIPATDNFEEDTYRAHRCRFALVYGVAAMDNYFTKKFTDNLTIFLKKEGITTELEIKLGEAGIDTSFFLELLQAGDFSTRKPTRPFKKIHSKIRQSLGKYTSQSTHKIDQLFKAYEITELSKHAIGKAKSDNLLRGIRKPGERLEKIVQRRHQIVHANDRNMKGRYNKIEAQRTREDLRIIEAFVKGAEAIINNRFKSLK